MKPLEDLIKEKGIAPAASYTCTKCGKALPAFALNTTVDKVEKETQTVIKRRPNPNHNPMDLNEAGEPTTPAFEDYPEEVTVVIVSEAVCANCIIDAERIKQRDIEVAERLRKKTEEPWNTDEADSVRSIRNIRIERVRWAIDPLTSPLTPAGQQKYIQYVKKLNRLTIDFATPESVQWPEEPVSEFPATPN